MSRQRPGHRLGFAQIHSLDLMTRLAPALLVSALLTACAHSRTPSMAPQPILSCRTASVQWLGPDDRSDRKRLDAWCAGVGPVIVAAGAFGPPREISPRDITFVSWNVHVGNGDIARFVNDLREGRLTDGRRPADIVLLLQEAVRLGDVPALPPDASGARRISVKHPPATDIREVGRALDMWLVYAPSMRNGNRADDPPEDRGNAILSTLPLSDARAVELPGERQRRVALFARLAPGSSDRVSVGVIHFDALAAPKQLWVFGTSTVRALQARWLSTVAPEGTLVLGADLNTWHGADEPAPKILGQLFAGTPVTADRSAPSHRVLDYMFFRAEGATARYRVVGDQYGSDHHPLIGWLQ
jgi:endonuclease/exonuclease/phosphatase family metal-dependent hydrolase